MDEQPSDLTTVAELIAALQTLDPRDQVWLYSDAEGNAVFPLDHIEESPTAIYLVPMHR